MKGLRMIEELRMIGLRRMNRDGPDFTEYPAAETRGLTR